MSCFELALAARRGRLQLPVEPAVWVEQALGPSGIELLPLDAAIALRAVSLPEHHRDPFDRMIIAQALVERPPLITYDSIFTDYDLKVI